jgi:hypothetical protein
MEEMMSSRSGRDGGKSPCLKATYMLHAQNGRSNHSDDAKKPDPWPKQQTTSLDKEEMLRQLNAPRDDEIAKRQQEEMQEFLNKHTLMMSGLSGRRNYNGNDDDSDQSC